MSNKSEQGFTYIDVMIAIVILLVGILALLAAITGAVFQSKGQEEQLEAKQIVTSTMEAIMSVKENRETDKTNSVRLGWDKVGNVGKNVVNTVAQGIFVNGFQLVYDGAGKDEIFGTADDKDGADGIAGNADDANLVKGFERQITISDECDTERPSPAPTCTSPGTFPVKVRSVVITVTYYVGTVKREEQARTLLTDYYITD